MTCDKLEIVSLLKGTDKEQLIDKESKFKSLVATGRVRITQADRVATCGRAEVLPGEDRIILTDNPVVEDKGHGVTWTGEELLLLRGQRRVQGKHVKVIGPAIKDLSYEKKDKQEKPLIEVPKANP